MKKKIFTVLILIVIFGGIAGALIFSNTDMRISVIFFGIIFFFVGLLGFFYDKPTYRNSPLLTFCIAGLLTIGIPTWILLSDKYPDKFEPISEDSINEFAGAITIIIGLCIAVFPTLAELHKRRVCTESVIARCVELKVKRLSGSSRRGSNRLYSPVWEFDFYGKTYVADENNYAADRFEIGEEHEIFVNPFNPQEVYREIKGMIASVLIFGVVFVAAGIWILSMG